MYRIWIAAGLVVGIVGGCDRRPVGPDVPAASCVPVTGGIRGGEDLAVMPAGLIGSFDDRRGASRGSLRLITVGPDGQPALSSDLTRGVPKEFRPHGLGVLETGDGLVVMAVNHPDGWEGPRSTVEIYLQESGDQLRHLRTVELPGYPRLNDVTPVSARGFYATNETGARRGSPGETLQFVLKRGDGALLYHDGRDTTVAADDFAFANSVERIADGGLAVSDSVRREVRLFAGGPVPGRLSPSGVVRLAGGPDNLVVAADGTLLVVAHDDLRAFARLAAKGEGSSPWTLARIRLTGQGAAAEPILSSDGVAHPAMSVAYEIAPGRFFVGSIFGEGTVCGPASGSAP